jgi:hypothetical protein
MARVKRRLRARIPNPIRTTGALIINPRKRRKAKVAKRRNALLVRANRRRRVSRRRNPLLVRANRAQRRRRSRRVVRRNPLLVRANPRRRVSRRRRNPLYTRVNRRKSMRRSMRRRRNPSGLAKIPVVGGVLSSIVGLFGPALFGAVSVEPTMLAARYLGPYIPSVPTSVFYPVAGLLLAGIVKAFGPKLMSKDLADKFAVACASAGGAVGYYKWRTSQDQEVAAEAGMLEYAGAHVSGYQEAGFGDGFAQRVVPFR